MTGIPAEALAVLVLPDLAGLPKKKARGVECVWCPARLAGSDIDLGERRRADGRPVFPWACRPCLATAAHRALFAHGAACERCRNEADNCPVEHGLYRIVRDHLRANSPPSC